VSKRLVTIATFDQVAQARLAENALKDTGISAMISDENLVAMDWLLSSAVGGVKVQVWEEDVEKAVSVLETRFGEHGEGFGANVSPEDLTIQAEAATPEPGEESVPAHSTPQTEAPESMPAAPESREEYARRLVFSAMLGLVFPPVAAYAVYLFLNAAFGEGHLSSRGKFNLYLGGLMALAGMIWFSIFLRVLIAR
jgi:hypothetical protein